MIAPAERAPVDVLRQVSLFAGLSPGQLEVLAARSHRRVARRGDVLCRVGEPGEEFFAIARGVVRIVVPGPRGDERLSELGPGDWFGEMALIDGQTVPATITAVVPTTIFSLSRGRFFDLLAQRSFVLALLRALTGRCRDAWQQIEVLTHHQAEARIRMALHQLCARKGVATPEGVRIDMPLTHRELASIAGVSRETATRVLGHLADARLVRVQGRRFVVSEPERLIEATLLE